MKKFISFLFVIAIAGFYALPAFGWGQEGHRIITRIAYDNLTCKARKQVDKIVGTRGIIYWSNWADEIKSDTIYPRSIKDGWHYQDFEAGLSDSLIADALVNYREEGGNLFRALDSIIDRFAQKQKTTAFKDKGSDAELVHTLRFIVHLSGDRYCPMHIAHIDDKGGNAVKMKWFGRETNLHSVWDGKIIESQGYSYTEYAQMLEDEYSGIKKEIEAKTDAELLIESYRLTEAIYAYQAGWDGNTYHYIYAWRQPMERQLYIAGIRLAKLLNNLF